MWLKLLIVFLVFLMILSLSGALVTLFQDIQSADEDPLKNRTVKLLAIRVSLAVLIIILLTYGYFSGTLTVQAPWAGHY